jgi:hypothetical protein
VRDVDKAREIVKKMAGEIGLEQATFDQTNSLLNDYEKERESLFRSMADLLGKSDTSDLLSEWKDFCDRGKDQLRRLNAISPGNGLGVVMVGLSQFMAGEFKIWDKNAQTEIARAAVDMKLIYLANVELVKACNQQLQDFFSSKKDLLDLVEGRFGATLDVAGKTATLIRGFVRVMNYKGLPPEYLNLFRVLTDNFKAVKEAAMKKNTLIKVLVGRLAMIKDVQSKLDIAAIDEAYRAGESAANSLQGIGKDSPYDAEDWNTFAQDCIEKLQGARDLAKDQSTQVFETQVNRLKEETAKSIEALTDDPGEQEHWNDQLVESFDSIQEAIDSEQTFLRGIVQGPKREAVAADWNLIQTSLKMSVEDLKATVAWIKDKVRGD